MFQKYWWANKINNPKLASKGSFHHWLKQCIHGKCLWSSWIFILPFLHQMIFSRNRKANIHLNFNFKMKKSMRTLLLWKVHSFSFFILMTQTFLIKFYYSNILYILSSPWLDIGCTNGDLWCEKEKCSDLLYEGKSFGLRAKAHSTNMQTR